MEKMSKMVQINVICRFISRNLDPRVYGFNVVINFKYTTIGKCLKSSEKASMEISILFCTKEHCDMKIKFLFLHLYH
jgi:hypothetical protein